MITHRQNLTQICKGKAVIYRRADTSIKSWHARVKYFEGTGYYVKSLKTEDKEEAMEIAEDWYRGLKYKHDNNLVVRKHTVAQLCKICIDKLHSDLKVVLLSEAPL